jgi:hypothetical protein
MVFYWYLKSFAVRERCVDSNLVATGIEMLLDIADDDFIWASSIIIEPDTDVNVWWIAAKQIGLTRETVAVYKQRAFAQTEQSLRH